MARPTKRDNKDMEIKEIERLVKTVCKSYDDHLRDDLLQDARLIAYEILSNKPKEKHDFNYIYTTVMFKLRDKVKQYNTQVYNSIKKHRGREVYVEIQEDNYDTQNHTFDEITTTFAITYVEQRILKRHYVNKLTMEEIGELYQDVLGVKAASSIHKIIHEIKNKVRAQYEM